MRVLVTGGTGFVGRHTVRRLVEGGHDVRCLVRASSDVAVLQTLGVRLVTGDVTERSTLPAAIHGCDWVIHAAGAATFWEPERRLWTDVNVTGARNVMECAYEANVAKVVHVSTALVWGHPGHAPFDEDSPVGPVRFSEYARTKYLGDLAAWELHDKGGLPLAVVYPCTVTGAHDTKLTGELFRRIAARRLPAVVLPDSVVTVVGVRDVAEAILRVAERPETVGRRYLLGAEQVTLGHIQEEVATIAGVPLPALRPPATLVSPAAAVLTFLADMARRPPAWGLSLDAVRTLRAGLRAEGGRVQRELGLHYTPVRRALEEAVATIRG